MLLHHHHAGGGVGTVGALLTNGEAELLAAGKLMYPVPEDLDPRQTDLHDDLANGL